MLLWRSMCGWLAVLVWSACTAPQAERMELEAAYTPAAGDQADPVVLGPSQARDELPSRVGRPTLGATPLPCELRQVLETSCQGCHAKLPGSQAPMALVSFEDLVAPAPSEPTRTVYEQMLERVHDTDAPMPPPSSRRLTAAELAVIDALAGTGPVAGADQAGCSGDVVPPRLVPPKEEEIGECYEVVAHQQPIEGDRTPHVVEPGESYSCFYFGIAWPAGAEALRVRTVAGAAAHHLELFEMESDIAPGEIFAQQTNCGVQPRTPISIWGLGQEADRVMPEDVGLLLPEPADGRVLMLEVHYANFGEAAMLDESRVEICTARDPQRELAGISTLSTLPFSIDPGEQRIVTATCSPAYEGDIHIFRSFPHMHGRGIGFDASILRAGGSEEPLLDIAYDANNQQIYELNAILHPGDQVVTRCHFRNDTERTIAQGYTSDDEMCNHFVYAWPAHALSLPVLGTSVPCVL